MKSVIGKPCSAAVTGACGMFEEPEAVHKMEAMEARCK